MAELNDVLRTLSGTLISKIEIDFRVTLVLEEIGSLALSCPFEVTRDDGFTHIVDPEGQKAELVPALELLNETVSELLITDAQLFLTTSNGARLHANADPNYEAWNLNLNRPERLTIISLPDGNLGIWGAINDSDANHEVI